MSDDAPGLDWRRVKDGRRVAYWRPPRIAREMGYPQKTVRLCEEPLGGAVPPHIADRCRILTAEALVWVAERHGVARPILDGTLGGLIKAYQTAEGSPFREVGEATREFYAQHLRLLERTVGARRLVSLSGDDFRRWHANFKTPKEKGGPERLRRAQATMQVLRIAIRYGTTLSDRAVAAECIRLAAALEALRFKTPQPRTTRITYGQACAVIATAHRLGHSGIAMAQAMQFELMLRQKDVLALDWSAIDANLILRLTTSKTKAAVEFALAEYPLVMTEISRVPPEERDGPVVKRRDGKRFTGENFARRWRVVADEAGLPKTVWNMDSRAGGVTEALDAGADLAAVRQHATHTNVTMTSRYDRSSAEKTKRVARLRVAARAGGK